MSSRDLNEEEMKQATSLVNLECFCEEIIKTCEINLNQNEEILNPIVLGLLKLQIDDWKESLKTLKKS